MVYLTDAYAPFFSMMATAEDDEGKALVVEVAADELPDDLFYPDEDFVAQCLSHQRGEPLPAVHGEVRVDLMDYQHHAADSMQALGNVAYRGIIPPSAITRYCIFDIGKQQSVSMAACDPLITPLNYKFCGNKYRSMVAWLFGDREDWLLGGYGMDDNKAWFEQMELAAPGSCEYMRKEFSNRDGITVTNLRGANE